MFVLNYDIFFFFLQYSLLNIFISYNFYLQWEHEQIALPLAFKKQAVEVM